MGGFCCWVSRVSMAAPKLPKPTTVVQVPAHEDGYPLFALLTVPEEEKMRGTRPVVILVCHGCALWFLPRLSPLSRPERHPIDHIRLAWHPCQSLGTMRSHPHQLGDQGSGRGDHLYQ